MITKKIQRVAFFIPDRTLPSNPTLVNIIQRLNDTGVEVDAFWKGYPKKVLDFPLFRTFPFPTRVRLNAGSFRKTLGSWKWAFLRFTLEGYGLNLKRRYDIIFGIDAEGLLSASLCSSLMNAPLVYLSFEIFFMDEIEKKVDQILKRDEIKKSKDAAFIITQDNVRAEAIAQENDLSIDKFINMPVAPVSTKLAIKSTYLREKYKIPRDKTIVLHSGSFEGWTCADDLIVSLDSWPHEFVLIIHTRLQTAAQTPLLKKLKNLNYCNVILSTNPLSPNEYADMVSSADIGLVLYKQVSDNIFAQKNLNLIGLASGKFSYYTRAGLPVIVSDQSVYRYLQKHYRFGEILKSFDDMPDALNSIKKNYGCYSSAAKKLFDEKLDFNLYWPALMDRITHVTGKILPNSIR